MSEQLRGRVTVWWANDWVMQSFEQLRAAGRGEEALGELTLLRPSIDMTKQGWVKAGEAEVVATLLPHTEVITNVVASLRQEQQNQRATAEMNCRKLEERIQSLLAITHEPEAL